MPLNRFLQGAFAEFNTDLDLSIYTEEFDKRQYFLNLREKFHSMLGISKDWITRQQVELVQPIIHQRYWMGVNNSANNSLAYTLNPLTDPVPALLSARVPWRYKLSGAFEAALTARLHERVARYPSRYGYDFAGPAPMSVRALDWLIAMCPLVVRPPLIRVAHRFRATRHHTPYWLTKDYLQTVVDLNNLEVSKYVRIERVVLPRLLNRVMTAELLLSNRF